MEQYLKQSQGKKAIFIRIVTIILAILLYVFLIDIISNLSYGENYESQSVIVSWLGIAIAAFSVYSWYVETKTLFSPYIIFFLFFISFNFGQCIMWAFGIHITTEIGKVALYNALPPPSSYSIFKAQLYSCLCIYFFNVGALFCYKPRKRDDVKNKAEVDIYYKVIFGVSCLIGLIAVPLTLYRALTFAQVSLESGYGAIYYSDQVKQGGVLLIAEIFLFPSLAGMLIGSKYKKKVVYFVYFIFFLYFLLNLLQGDRGSWLYKIIALIWLSHSFYKPIDYKKSIRFIVLSIIALYFLYALISLRGVGFANISLEDFGSALSFENFPVVLAMFEMGGSMSIILILLDVGSDVWTSSNSYIVSILGVLTTKIPEMLGYKVVLIENWFSQGYLKIRWGAGFSMIGEAFINYGLYVTPFILIIIGYFIGSMLHIKVYDDPKNYPLRYFFVVTSLTALTGWSRASSIQFLRDWFRGTVVVCLLIIIVVKLLSRFNHSEHKRV